MNERIICYINSDIRIIQCIERNIKVQGIPSSRLFVIKMKTHLESK